VWVHVFLGGLAKKCERGNEDRAADDKTAPFPQRGLGRPRFLNGAPVQALQGPPGRLLAEARQVRAGIQIRARGGVVKVSGRQVVALGGVLGGVGGQEEEASHA
jgi:hypothetical protein